MTALTLTALVMFVGMVGLVIYYGGHEKDQDHLFKDASIDTTHDDAVSTSFEEFTSAKSEAEEHHQETKSNPTNSHLYEAPPVDTSSYHNPLPSGPADINKWSSLPVTSTEDHTLGYPFVAACVTVDEETKALAKQMVGEFDMLEVFPNRDDNHNEIEILELGLFGSSPEKKNKKKTWTYTFLLHDEEDFAHFLNFGMDYVPDLVLTRDIQDSRIGISHEDEEYDEVDSPGRRRRLAKPQCNDGTCRKSCADCTGTGEHNDSQGNPCCGDSDSYVGTGECAIVAPIDFNAMFVPGETGSYEGINQYSCYRTVSGTNTTVDDLLTAYPDLTEKIMLDGYPTHENKLYLYVLVLTNKNFNTTEENPAYGDKGKLLATSSIHSREFAPAETMLRLAEYGLQNYDTDPDLRLILDWNEIHLILHANPDGRVFDEVERDFWRKNRRVVSPCSSTSSYGTDLNRNFPFAWNDPQCSGCSSSTCSAETFRGDSESSEQETKAIVEYAASIFPTTQRQGDGSLEAAELAGSTNTPFPETNMGVFMDVHSYGRDVGYAWAHKDPETNPNLDGVGSLARKMASYNEYT